MPNFKINALSAFFLHCNIDVTSYKDYRKNVDICFGTLHLPIVLTAVIAVIAPIIVEVIHSTNRVTRTVISSRKCSTQF